jgi:DNA-binding GntR family transcriptional regulator
LPVVCFLVDPPIDGQSLFAIPAKSHGVDLTRAESIIEVTRCDPAESELPGIAAGSQALLVESALKSHRRTARVVHVIDHSN